MRHVALRAADRVVLDNDRLRGTMISRSTESPPVFDDPRSYLLDVSFAELSMSLASLEALMNEHMLAYDNAPLTKVRLSVDEESRLVMKGVLRSAVPVPISAKAHVGATADGRLRLQVNSMQALGIPVTGLLEFLGLHVDDLISLKRRGVEVRSNDMLIIPGHIVPPPEMRGALTEASIVGDRLVQRFGSSKPRDVRALVPPEPKARNYVYFNGGNIRFGKLTMRDADLQLIDLDPKDPFDFYPARYQRQLVAGYSKTTSSGGLKTFMPDAGDMDAQTAMRRPSR
jgi:hypothetical protein